MPVLKNPKHERFAQEMAMGKNGVDAYLAAYDLEDRGAASRNAYRLRNRSDVKDRIEELGGKRHRKKANKQIAEAVRDGREPDYRPEFNALGKRLALLGVSEAAMGEYLGVADSTLRDWIKQHPGFAAAVKAGGGLADAEVAESLFHRAKGYQHQAVKIFMPAGAQQPVYAEYTERYAPDTQAASLWLRNRQSTLWREKREIEHTGAIEHQIAQMSQEERRARLFDLTERARVIEHDEHEFDDGPDAG